MVENCVDFWWAEVKKKLRNSVLFVDDSMAELLHFYGGLPVLFEAGCLIVKSLSPFEVYLGFHLKYFEVGII